MTEHDNLEFLDTPKPKTETEDSKRRMGSIILIVTLIAFALALAVQLSFRNETQPTEGLAPDFYLELFDGSDFQLSEQKGKVVLINFWASWCAACREEAPLLQAMYREYQDDGLLIIGVNWLESSRQKALDYVDEFGITFPNGEDVSEIVARLYNITAVPESFLIDKDGNIQQAIIGIINIDELSITIETLLAE
jgi:cytochrome c biogenesis protein CcmG, thiol:disulfide interchange protein DsbE